MAAVALIFGGFAGYVLAMLAYLIFGTGLLTALTVWSLGGILIVILAILAGRFANIGHGATAQA